MTDQELADALELNIKALHGKIDALPDGATKKRAGRLVFILHRAAEELRDIAVDLNLITAFSGGEEKPPEGP